MNADILISCKKKLQLVDGTSMVPRSNLLEQHKNIVDHLVVIWISIG